MGYFKNLHELNVEKEQAKKTCECVRCMTPLEESDFNEGNGFCFHCVDMLIREDMRSTFAEASLCR